MTEAQLEEILKNLEALQLLIEKTIRDCHDLAKQEPALLSSREYKKFKRSAEKQLSLIEAYIRLKSR